MNLQDVADLAMTLGSGMVAQPVAGLAGLGTLAAGQGSDAAANRIRSTQERLTHAPDSEVSRDVLVRLAALLEPLQRAKEGLGGAMGEAGYGPGMQTAAYMIPDAILSALPFIKAGGLAELGSGPMVGTPLAQLGAVGKAAAARSGTLSKLAGAEPALGNFETTTAKRILAQTKANGGYTVNLQTGEVPKEGIMMVKYPNEDPRNLIDANVTPRMLEQWLAKNKTLLRNPNNFLGSWIDNGKTYVGVSQKFDPTQIRQATVAGERTGQLAGWDIGKAEETPVGNWSEWLQGPEFASRVRQMAEQGRLYLAQHPANEWWDLFGSPIEETYGTERMPQAAGYIASTAPNSDPISNLQTASEYMRRFIKGEPTIQPDWRVGDAGGPPMTRKPGTQIGMEDTRAGNLELSTQGRYKELSGQKVNAEARALMGDPDAMVFDRWWARLGEKPEMGVFTSGKEDAFRQPTASDPGGYTHMENVVRPLAGEAGRDPRDFSADVWAGMREQVRNTGELFGQDMRSSQKQIQNVPSKSYGDLQRDLIVKKANFLGITPQEMMDRLRSGDANLLQWVLGAGVGKSLYDLALPSGANQGGT